MNEDKNIDIGGQFKARREELGYSLKNAAERTRIRQGYLESMEGNRFSELPGRAYVTGFVRVYARYLGLDGAALLKMLDETSVVEEDTVQPVIVSAPEQTSAKKTSRSGWTAFLIGFVVVLVLGGAIFVYFPSGSSDVPRIIELPSEEKPLPEAVTVEPVSPVEEPQDGVPEETDIPAPVADPEPLEQKTPVVDLPAIKSDGSSLRMLAMFDSSLIIYVDKRKPHEYKLHTGLDLTWRVAERVRIEMAEPAAARFWLDGKEVKLDERADFELLQAP